VNNQIHIEKSYPKIGLIGILLVVAFMCPRELFAQDTNEVKIPASEIELDSLKQPEKPKGIIKKILQPFKFKENRKRKEQERIYLFMKKMIDSSKLKIDTTTVNEIMNNLNLIQGNIENLKNNNDSLDQDNDIFKKEIEAIISTYDLDKKASKVVIDSLKAQMTSVIQENVDNNKKEKDTLQGQETTGAFLKQLRSVPYSCKCIDKAPQKYINEKDTLSGFKRCLKPKKKIIGWHNSWNKTEFKNYNYNYLSCINLYGFELSDQGYSKNPEDIEEFQRSGGVIEFAQSKGSDVHLTIYNKHLVEISGFLNNPDAQITFFEELDILITDNELKGVNIFFENVHVTDDKRFVEFISQLREILTAKDDTIILSITIPSIWKSDSLKHISAYNFIKLNPIVDYYLVLTDRMTSLKNKLALGFSPLNNGDTYGQKTIASTINFYSNGKIPLSKLIMSVSYLGIDWQVKDFSGAVVARTKGKELKYNEIVESYVNSHDPKRTIVKGFDSIQVAAYLNVRISSSWGGKPKYRQIWYENSQSLALKYKWMIENDLAGVSIRGLGYDDGYSDLWDVLGTTLVQIDTISLDENEHHKKGIESCLYIPEAYNFGLFKSNDWEKDSIWTHYQAYNSKDDTLGLWGIFVQDNLWAAKPILEYKTNKVSTIFFNDEGKEKNLLNNEKTCKCLISRWFFYSIILFRIAIVCLLALVILRIWTYQQDRYNQGSEKKRFFIRTGAVFFGALFLLTTLGGIYLAPWIPSIGTSHKGGMGLEILIVPAIVSFVIGWWFKIWYNKGRFVRKGLP